MSGSHYFVPTNISLPNVPERTNLEMLGDGTTAIARTTPTSPVFSASTALGEVYRDGLPALVGFSTWKERAEYHYKEAKRAKRRKPSQPTSKPSSANQASGEFLNYQFGWVPLVNDIRNFAYSVNNFDKILTDYQRGSDQLIRVGYSYPDSSSSTHTTGNVNISYSDGTPAGTVTGATWMSAKRRTWFSGAFQYHIPVGDDVASKMSRYSSYANRLFGVRLTPEVLWDLAPWSWAIDWQTNAGDVIHNISTLGSDGLVLKYGYVMSEVRREVRVTATSGSAAVPAGYNTYKLYLKQKRLQALPYFGFGAVSALSATQTAVLAALGMNRVSK